MGETIEIETSDGATIGAYRVAPSASPKGAIVVVQEAFGVNHHIRSVADRLAAEGYLTIAPALYDRKERSVELGYEKPDVKRGIALASAIPMEQHLLSVEAAIDTLDPESPIGIVGFCLGGSIAYAMAARSQRLSAAVGYYGGRIAGMAGAPLKCPVVLHFGEKDPNIPLTDVATIKAAHPDVPVYTYDADHGFNCDERGAYDKPSADLAWRRTLDFFARTMRPS